MELSRVGKARNLMTQVAKAKEALIDAFGQGMVTEDKRTYLLLIREIAAFCERDEEEITLVEAVISSLLRKRTPATGDVVEVLDILNECKQDLKIYIIEKMHLSDPKPKEFTEYYTAISEGRERYCFSDPREVNHS